MCFCNPFRTNKYESLKGILIGRRGLTTPERVNKVISGEKIGNDIPSRFLRRLQKTAGFGTEAVVDRAVIRQAFIRQMPASIHAHLATQPDSAPLESLAMLADWALASDNDVDESKPGVAEIKVSETAKLVGLLEDLSRRLNKLETVTSTMASEKWRNTGRARANDNRTPRAQYVPNVQAQPFIPNRQGSFKINIMKIAVRTYRRRTHRKIMLRHRPIRPIHLSAIITRPSVIKHAHAETLARSL